MHGANTKVLELISFKHIGGETLTGWTQTAERMTQNLKIDKVYKECHKITNISMQLAETCMNLLLTHIKLVKLLQDGHTLMKESLNTFTIDKSNSEWSKND